MMKLMSNVADLLGYLFGTAVLMCLAFDLGVSERVVDSVVVLFLMTIAGRVSNLERKGKMLFVKMKKEFDP